MTSQAVTFEPNPLELSFEQYERVQFEIAVVVSGDIGGSVQIDIQDSKGIIEESALDPFVDNGRIEMALHTKATVSAGIYRGVLTFNLCADLDCTHYSGQGRLPYTFDVVDTVNLTSLSRLPGVSEWATTQGSATHSGYVPVTLDPAAFNIRWVWRAPEFPRSVGEIISPAVTDDGKVFVTIEGRRLLYAIDEYAGAERWHHEFTLNSTTGTKTYAPATSDGSVFVTAADSRDSYLWAFDAESGNVPYRITFAQYQQQALDAPIFAGDDVVVGGAHFGAWAFDRHSGALAWVTGSGGGGSPAYDGTLLFGYADASLEALDPSSGEDVYQILGPRTDGVADPAQTPMLVGDSDDAIAYSAGAVVSFNTGERTVNWSKLGQYVQRPAEADGVVYALNNNFHLDALRLSDGQFLWKWVPPSEEGRCFYSSPIVTDNLVFVSTCSTVYAIDLVSHEAVWSYPHPGTLALSPNAILYISRKYPGATVTGASRLTAINLH